jgi:lysine-specific demethylase 3
MYNAFAGKETAGGQGSTRMHMDVADAVNIMLYASPMADGSPGCAVWDLFRAEDADAIRDFLTTKYAAKAKFFTDPIHSQMFYLDAALRQELFEHKGVKSFRVYQYPGQAVFIPAGCAHQVCNLAGCIKIALDFVSPRELTS